MKLGVSAGISHSAETMAAKSYEAGLAHQKTLEKVDTASLKKGFSLAQENKFGISNDDVYKHGTDAKDQEAFERNQKLV